MVTVDFVLCHKTRAWVIRSVVHNGGTYTQHTMQQQWRETYGSPTKQAWHLDRYKTTLEMNYWWCFDTLNNFQYLPDGVIYGTCSWFVSTMHYLRCGANHEFHTHKYINTYGKWRRWQEKYHKCVCVQVHTALTIANFTIDFIILFARCAKAIFSYHFDANGRRWEEGGTEWGAGNGRGKQNRIFCHLPHIRDRLWGMCCVLNWRVLACPRFTICDEFKNNIPYRIIIIIIRTTWACTARIRYGYFHPQTFRIC